MIEISTERWRELTAIEKRLANVLGIKPRKSSTRSEQMKPVIPKPYLLKARIHCYLCKSKTEQFFNMVLCKDEGSQYYLHSTEITKEKEISELHAELPLRSQDIYVSTCTVCPDTLLRWEKEELIKKLIEVFPAARVVMVTGGKSTGRW